MQPIMRFLSLAGLYEARLLNKVSSHPFNHQPACEFPVTNDDGVKQIDEVLAVGFVQLAHNACIQHDKARSSGILSSANQQVAWMKIPMDEVLEEYLWMMQFRQNCMGHHVRHIPQYRSTCLTGNNPSDARAYASARYVNATIGRSLATGMIPECKLVLTILRNVRRPIRARVRVSGPPKKLEICSPSFKITPRAEGVITLL